MILWFALFHNSSRKNQKFQPLTEAGRELVASVMSRHGFPSHSGADGWSQDPSPWLRKWMQLPCSGSSAGCHAEELNLCYGARLPSRWNQQTWISKGRNSPPFNQESSNNWPGSLSTCTQSLTLGWAEESALSSRHFWQKDLFILLYSLCRKCLWAPPHSVSSKAQWPCLLHIHRYLFLEMNRGWFFFLASLVGPDNMKRRRKERRNDEWKLKWDIDPRTACSGVGLNRG